MAGTLDSRVWFVTGSSSGFGLALIEAVLAINERVVATLRDVTKLADLQAKYPADQLLILPLDVTNTAQIAQVFKQIEQHFHRLDIVVNNAGYALAGEIEGIPEDEARRQLDTLFWGPVAIMKEATRFFREVNPQGHGGRILNISSIGGYEASQLVGFYAAGKFALEGLTQSFNKEMPPQWNVKATIIEPGGFATNIWTSGLVMTPPHPAYPEDSPTAQFRKNMTQWEAFAIGDVKKAAQAIILVAGDKDAPLRVQLGSDAWFGVNLRANTTLKDQEKWAAVSHGTNLDSHSGPDAIAKLKALMGA
ncbi:NAD(P)-binding protein [Auriscalpium vulgare]|uniref:NAD(P)-binding protein n=1 Tax=Auriscalpium vulgare TaxID=40419 RepID=A0ACB8R166_9AGAM|nr:NAD(P)-binding protein [Auriscalpium vulgare]